MWLSNIPNSNIPNMTRLFDAAPDVGVVSCGGSRTRNGKPVGTFDFGPDRKGRE